jgi:phage-related protein
MTHTTLAGAPFVATQNNDLYLEGVKLADLAHAHGTPLFVYSKAAMLSALAAYQRGFVKKTQATPIKELRLAKQRMKEVLND